MWNELLSSPAGRLSMPSSAVRLLRRLYPRLRSVAIPSAALLAAVWAGHCVYRWGLPVLRTVWALPHGSGKSCSPSDSRTSARAANSNGDNNDDDDDDDIGFVDPAVSAYRVFRRRVERLHEAPLLRVINELEAAGARWRELRAQRLGREPSDAEALEERQLEARVRQKAMEGDELLTQLIVQLDLAPVGNSAALRQERKVSILEASALAERIATWAHLPPQHGEG